MEAYEQGVVQTPEVTIMLGNLAASVESHYTDDAANTEQYPYGD